MRNRKWVICAALAALSWGYGTLINAENLPPEEVIKHRVANFRKIGKAFKGIRDQLKGNDPSLNVIQESARQIDELGSQILTWFPAGTDVGDTKAKPAVWSERGRFEEAQKKFYGEAQRMNQVAQAGDKSIVATQYKVLGRTCKGCHDAFRGNVDEQ